jgi:hypothetical protein
MNGIKFSTDPRSCHPEDAFVAHIPGDNDKTSILKQLCINLKFPDYFGFNWDALDECLRDLQWIEQRKVVLVHDDMPVLSEKDIKTYLYILNSTIEDWQHFRDQPNWHNWKEHSFEVVFPENAKEIICRYPIWHKFNES